MVKKATKEELEAISELLVKKFPNFSVLGTNFDDSPSG
jgi:hypothetical protein